MGETKMPKASLLSPQQRLIYAKYGKALHELPVTLDTLAKQLGVTRWTVRRVAEHVAEFGPPTDHELPTWRVVVIPDAHFGPEEDGSRARLFGLEITRQGEIAMENGERFAFCSIGDWHDMALLSHYDKGTIDEWGRYIQDDINAGNSAIALMKEHICKDVWEYAEEKFVTIGNHEDRIKRTVREHGALSGFLGMHVLAWESHGFEQVPFLTPKRIEDVMFSHYFASPGNGRAISSVNMGRQLIMKTLCSVVVGHNHLYKTDVVTAADGRKLVGTSVGCAFEHHHEWAGQSNLSYDRGIVVLTNLKGCFYTPNFIPLKELRKRYAD